LSGSVADRVDPADGLIGLCAAQDPGSGSVLLTEALLFEVEEQTDSQSAVALAAFSGWRNDELVDGSIHWLGAPGRYKIDGDTRLLPSTHPMSPSERFHHGSLLRSGAAFSSVLLTRDPWDIQS
jgi:hypothetical protein